MRTIRRIVEAEQYVPESVTLSAETITPTSTTPVRVNPPAVRNNIDPDWSRYQLRR